MEEIANEIESAKKVKEQAKPLKYLEKIEKPVPRPPTPTVPVPSEEDESQELALIFLQKVSLSICVIHRKLRVGLIKQGGM